MPLGNQTTPVPQWHARERSDLTRSGSAAESDTITFASASNGVPDAVTPGASEAVSTDDKKAGRKDLPLTVDQLIEVAAAPQLDLFP
jgi:hypothetical protein